MRMRENRMANNESRAVTIDRVLSEVQQGLANAQQRVGQLLSLKTVTLTLQTAVVQESGGAIKVFIFSFGKEWEKARSQELVLTLGPPKRALTSKVEASLAAQLEEAIVSVAGGVQKAREGSPPLELTQFTAEFSFAVMDTKKKGVDFEIVPVSGGLKGKLTEKALHKIQVLFGPP